MEPDKDNERLSEYLSKEVFGRQNNVFRQDARNRFLVCSPSSCPSDIVRIIRERSVAINVYDPLTGTYVPWRIITEEEWARTPLGTIPIPRLGPDFYDESYYKPGAKNSFDRDFVWDEVKDAIGRIATDVVKTFNPESVLDVGCAYGFFMKSLLLRGVKDVAGFDISNWAITHSEPDVRGMVRQFQMGDGKKLPYPDNRFDLVNAESVMEHMDISDIPFYLQEMRRVSKKWVLVGVPIGPTRENRPFGDMSHRTILPSGWWIKQAWDAGLIYEPKLSKYQVTMHERSEFEHETCGFAFRKDRLDHVDWNLVRRYDLLIYKQSE